MSPHVNTVQFALPLSAEERRILTEAAKAAAPDGTMPVRSRWIVAAALGVTPGQAEIDAATTDVPGNRRIMQVSLLPEQREAIRARAGALGLTSAGLVRAAALAEAKRLGVK